MPTVSDRPTPLDSWAYVRAVRQVVRAVLTREELVEERGLVARAAGGVEERLVRACEAAQGVADDGEGLVPGDRRVVGRAGAKHHRLGEPTGLGELEVGEAGELLDGVLLEEGGVAALPRRLLGERLRAVLAVLGDGRAVSVGIRPGAAGAVEAALLVHARQLPGRLESAVPLALHVLERDANGAHPAALVGGAVRRSPVRVRGPRAASSRGAGLGGRSCSVMAPVSGIGGGGARGSRAPGGGAQSWGGGKASWAFGTIRARRAMSGSVKIGSIADWGGGASARGRPRGAPRARPRAAPGAPRSGSGGRRSARRRALHPSPAPGPGPSGALAPCGTDDRRRPPPGRTARYRRARRSSVRPACARAVRSRRRR